MLESTGRSVDKQATGRARTGPRVTIDSGRLSGSQGVTTFLKVTDERGHVKLDLGDMQGALWDYNEALARKSQLANTYSKRGIVKSYLGDKHGAIDEYSQAIAVDSRLYSAYANRGSSKHLLGDKNGPMLTIAKPLFPTCNSQELCLIDVM